MLGESIPLLGSPTERWSLPTLRYADQLSGPPPAYTGPSTLESERRLWPTKRRCCL